MLTELTIRDFAIIDELRIEFRPGFNVLTGETGAGKSIVVDALQLLAGGRPDVGMIRGGAEAALVQATFDHEGVQSAARRLSLGGRHTARVNGELVTVADVRGEQLRVLLAALVLSALLACFIAKFYLGAALMVVPLVALFVVWAWTTGHRQAPVEVEARPGLVLPTQYAARNAPGWWALVTSLLIDGALFASLVFAYFYLWLGTEAWPPAGIGIGGLGMPLVALGLLGGCAVAAQVAWRALLRDGGHGGAAWLATAGLGVAFAITHWLALAGPVGAPQVHAYASVVWTLAGFHLVHVAVAVLASLFVAARLRHGYVNSTRPLEARVVAHEGGVDEARTGGVVRFRAVVRDARGTLMEDVPVAWSHAYTPVEGMLGVPATGQIQDGAYVADVPGLHTVTATAGTLSARHTFRAVARDVVQELEVSGHALESWYRTTDIWAFEGVDGRDYAITGSKVSGGFAFFYDITTPAAIQKIDSIQVGQEP